VLFVTVWPYPAWPYSLTPYIFVAALVTGARYMLWLERRHPGALQAFSLYRPTGLPYSYHPVLLSGERAALGLASPSGRVRRVIR